MAITVSNSFVVRFVQEECDGEDFSWYGLIRHVQSNQQIYFTRLDDALAFIAKFVDTNIIQQGDHNASKG